MSESGATNSYPRTARKELVKEELEEGEVLFLSFANEALQCGDAG